MGTVVIRALNVLRRRWIAIAAVVAVGMLICGYTLTVAPTYEARSSVMLPPTTPNDPNSESSDVMQLSALASSTNILGKIRDDLHLQTPVWVMRKALASPIFPGSNILPITYRDENPQLAVAVANGVAEQIAAYYKETHSKRYDDLIQSLRQQRDAAQTRVVGLDRQLQLAVKQNSAFGIADTTSALAQRMADLDAARTRAQTQLDADAAQAASQTQAASQLSPLFNQEQLDASSEYRVLSTRLAQDQADLTRERAQYTEDYPGVVALREQIAREKRDLDAFVKNAQRKAPTESHTYATSLQEGNRAHATVAGDRAAVARIDAQIAETHRALDTLPTAGVRVAELKRERDIANANLATLSASLTKALSDQASAVALNSVLVVDRATLAETVLPRHVRLRLVTAFLASLVLGIALAYFIEILEKRVRTPEELSALSGRPVLAIASGNGAELEKTAAKAIGSVRAEIEVAITKPWVVVVTSAERGDGKTLVALALARSFAEAGHRTALVDINHHRPEATRSLNATAVEAPSNWQTFTAPGVNGRVRNLEAISLASTSFARATSATRIRGLADDLRERYDVCIVDASEIADDALGLQFAAAADGVVIAVRLHRPLGYRDQRLDEVLARIDARVFGIVAIEGSGGSSSRQPIAPARPSQQHAIIKGRPRPADSLAPATGADDPTNA